MDQIPLLPIIVNIKSEKEDFNLHKEKHLDFHLDIKIETEAPHIIEDYDWCIENEAVSSSNKDANRESLDYYQLTQSLKQQCTRCDRYFDDRYSLLQHNLTHLKVYLIQCTYLLKYKCSICNIFYNTQDKLKEHTMVIHGSKYTIRAKSNKSLKLERQCGNLEVETFNDSLVIPKSLRQCTECGKIFTYKSWFSHMKSVHSTGKSTCQICKKTFKCERYFRRHLLYQHGNVKPSWRFHKTADNEIECEKCPAVFVNKNSLKTHMRNCHTESVQCDICKSKLKSKAYLLAHMRRVHYDDGKEHKCEICGKKFKSPRYVKIHIKNKHGLS